MRPPGCVTCGSRAAHLSVHELHVDGFAVPFRVQMREQAGTVALSWFDGAVHGTGRTVAEAERSFAEAAQRRLVVMRTNRDSGMPLTWRTLRILTELENQVGVAQGVA